jgi:tellurite methyltransferase
MTTQLRLSDCLSEHDWLTYYRGVEGRPPRETLLTALNQFDREPGANPSRLAVDLGCGDGRDTIELLHRGWQVLAIDGNPEALERLRERVQHASDRLAHPDHSPGLTNHQLANHQLRLQHLQLQQMRFETLVLPTGVDLINASFCLTFCPPESFTSLWQSVTKALKIGGRFCGQLFGDRDSWSHYPDRTHHTRSQVEELLHPFAIEYFEEEEHPGITPLGEAKQWHLFHIVARKTGEI